MSTIFKASWLFLTFSILTSCGSITIHDSLGCTVSGKVEAGANCTKTVSGAKTQINFYELIDMLEPNDDHGPAVIIPLNDFIEIKKEIESACVYLRCSKSVKKKLNNILKNVHDLIGEKYFNKGSDQTTQNVIP